MTSDAINSLLAQLHARTREDVADEVGRALDQQIGRDMGTALKSAFTELLWQSELRLREAIAAVVAPEHVWDFGTAHPNSRCLPVDPAVYDAPIGTVVAVDEEASTATIELDPALRFGNAKATPEYAEAGELLAAARSPTARDLMRDGQRSSTGGKRVNAPCGHEGEAVIGSYVRCLEGCDGEAVVVRDRASRKTQCLHRNTGVFFDPDFFDAATRKFGRRVRICFDCKERL